MKLKSLFLASLAAMAMVSCSNDNEVLNSENNSEKAFLQFSLTLPASPAGTRADEYDNPKYQTGEDEENNWTSATIFMKYSNSTTVSYTFQQSQFTQSTTANPSNSGDEPNTNAVWTLKDANKKEVVPGTVTECVVYLNDTKRIGLLEAIEVNKTPYSTRNQFLMNGKGVNAANNEESITFVAGKTTTVAAKVNRVVAKIENATTTITNLTPSEDEEALEMKTITWENGQAKESTTKLVFDLKNYVITNQAKKANEFGEATASATGDYLNEHKTHATSVASENETWNDFTGAKGFESDKITYVLANNNSDYKSQLIVQAVAKVKNATAAQTFYVYKETLYPTFNDLSNAVFNGGLNESDFETVAECAALGIRKYVDGVCYYHADITTNETGLVRNNWYKFNIKNVGSLGTPEVDIEEGEPAWLLMTVEIVNWTVWTNNITLN